ncbi:MAG TPA: DUF4157 domain-containing protein, partial [Candidatus Sulfopaludibacter sp.]|nr:DUF4157 domain-containing protein [Candidatus Sulfopaludibacter sp.]
MGPTAAFAKPSGMRQAAGRAGTRIARMAEPGDGERGDARRAGEPAFDATPAGNGFHWSFGRMPVFGTHAAPRIQAKLKVGAASDPLEREADEAAERVMRTAEPMAAAAAISSGASPGIRRKCGCGGTCDQCREEKGETSGSAAVRMKSAAGDRHAGMPAPPSVHEVLRSPGQPLDSATRGFMERRFGHDFSQVRVHAAGAADG